MEFSLPTLQRNQQCFNTQRAAGEGGIPNSYLGEVEMAFGRKSQSYKELKCLF